MVSTVTPAALRTRIESDLRTNVLPFWIREVANRPARTFHGELTNDLVIAPQAERGSLLTSRILWTYAGAFARYRDPALREMAELALHDLHARFRDNEHGGYFWSVDAAGRVLRDRKQVYGQAFAIYALSEFHAATGSDVARDEAAALFALLERHARDPEHGGYFEAFSRDWSPIADMRLSEVDQNDPKSQNTMLHVMEAYTRLLQLWPEPRLHTALREIVGLMLDRIVDPRTAHLGLFFSADWQPTSRKISYGHDIEAAWLLTRAAEVLDDAGLVERVHALALRIAEVTLREGTDRDGAIVNLGDPFGIVDDTREWWPQAEAVVGYLSAWQLSGESRFYDAAVRAWEFIDRRLVDRVHGEWFRGVTKDGSVIERFEKVGFWKCPYHNGRMGLEVAARLAGL